MAIDLRGRTIVITGASSGIGAATARACAAAGMQCVVAARREQELAALADELGSACRAIPGDVTQPGFNETLLACEPYAVLANAGRGLEQAMIDCDMAQFRALFEVNLFAAVELASLAAKQMAAGWEGHILLCASCLSKFAIPQHTAYCASKAAVERVARAMQMELRSTGVHVTSVHPIGTRTEFFDTSAALSGHDQSDFIERTPKMFMQPPNRVADAVVRCLRRPRGEVWTSHSMRLASTLFSAFPRLAQALVARFRP
ncbi:MAG: SDR family NAD(P)-dependent oxidoreductase [Phycisphaerales bacterium]|nr:SDR family NAD(P)-dependent oxidoreductase [Phycisphaerales bacterium]